VLLLKLLLYVLSLTYVWASCRNAFERDMKRRTCSMMRHSLEGEFEAAAAAAAAAETDKCLQLALTSGYKLGSMDTAFRQTNYHII
jgi:hypothetical protein